jgi:hypothetical protein
MWEHLGYEGMYAFFHSFAVLNSMTRSESTIVFSLTGTKGIKFLKIIEFVGTTLMSLCLSLIDDTSSNLRVMQCR